MSRRSLALFALPALLAAACATSADTDADPDLVSDVGGPGGKADCLEFGDCNGSDGELTALQKHVTFFDRNRDGFITVVETTSGLRALGFGKVRSGGLAVAIHAGLSGTTGTFLDPMTLVVSRMHFGKHNSDTDIFDEQGKFSPEHFDRLFDRYDENGDDGLDEAELEEFFWRNAELLDVTGPVASRAEFGLLMEIAGDEIDLGGTWWLPWTILRLPRERLAAFYDGTLFFLIADEPAPF